MAYTPVQPEELKKSVMMGKKRVMNLAYNPGPQGDDLLIIERIKAPEVIGRIAKKQGEGTKVAIGTFELDGKILRLTASQVVPALAKRLRKYLKTLDLSFRIEVLDPSGDLIESEDDEGAQPQGAVPASAGTENAPSDTDRKAAVTEALKAAQAPLAALGPAGNDLRKVAAAIVGLIKAGDLEKAEKALALLQRGIEKAEAQDTASDQIDAKGTSTPEAKAVLARVSDVKSVLEDMPKAEADIIKAHLKQALEALSAQDIAEAEAQLALAEATQLSTVNPVDEDAQAASERPDPAQQKWETAAPQLQARVDAAMAARTGDTAAILRAFDYAKSQAEAGDFTSALKAGSTTVGLLKEAAGAPNARIREAEDSTADNTVAYVQSRLSWIKTRNGLQAELVKLKMAIDTQTKGIEGLEEIAQNTGVLFDYLDALDTSLETKLEALVETPDSPARAALKAEAIKVISHYRETLDSDFFKAVDDNGFTKTTIRSTALDALADVETALAA
ncbi:hypothetical protein Z945_3656 [Sulfitobacter noctilucae]|uniref:hypothetical protein n=1 Tax=Sulfitobacter noctilucae TaxID=1342302 RepID=UPI0004697839|nr:hypothetical protein [Sulfitobacter noctilucae]KIN70280.1 hypothetical protein Z945_3656 [Sulfitobacter noctilucae]